MIEFKISEVGSVQFPMVTLAAGAPAECRPYDFLFSRPVFASTHFVQGSNIPRPTALRFLAVLREDGVLRTIRDGAGRRAAIFAFPALLNIAEGRPVL